MALALRVPIAGCHGSGTVYPRSSFHDGHFYWILIERFLGSCVCHGRDFHTCVLVCCCQRFFYPTHSKVQTRWSVPRRSECGVPGVDGGGELAIGKSCTSGLDDDLDCRVECNFIT